MIVYDKEQKEIVIPNGIGNINLYNNGVEAGYNQGYEQGQADLAAKSRVFNVTKNGTYMSKYSDPIVPTVTGVYADGTEFYNYAELNGKIFNTKIAATIDSRLEFWYKGDNTKSGDGNNVIIGSGDTDKDEGFQVKYYGDNNNIIRVQKGRYIGDIHNWDDTVWHHLIISKAEGIWLDGNNQYAPSLNSTTVNGEFFINGIGYDVNSDGGGTRNANGYFGMIKIDDTIIIPTADGFLNTNTGELLEVVQDGSYAFTENPPIYGEGELYKTINVNVPDLNGSYDEGYAQGKTDGINEQKAKLESINITENGTYTKEDGYNHIEVNVADLNGSYDEGYAQGQADVAANARVLNVTENGKYLSKFSDPIPIGTITGVYNDGTEFNNYAELNGKIFNTKIAGSLDSRIELWYKGDNKVTSGGEAIIIGSGDIPNSDCFRVRYTTYYNDRLTIDIGNSTVYFYDWDDTVWHHLIVSKAKGLWIDGDKIGDFSPSNTINGEFFINGIGYGLYDNANGCYGMIKIDDIVIIPTADGFLNTNTGELLEVVKDGSYTYTEGQVKYGEGELYKTINVNVIPKINPQKERLRLGYSKFTEVPEWVDFEGATDMSYMFIECSNLQTMSLINTSNATDMSNMFNNCRNLQTIPLLNTSNVTNMSSMFQGCSKLQTIPLLNTSKVTNMYYMFGSCSNLQTIPPIDTSNVTNMGQMFYDFFAIKTLVSLPKFNCQKVTNMSSYFSYYGDGMTSLTDVGGWENLKCNWNDGEGLATCPNLTKESCLNILNNLYDFTGNGETPNSGQGHLKVHQNFLDKVGDEISIGTLKGWSISAG